jgi:hypothetical protein
MARAHRDVPKSQAPEQLANAPLMQMHFEHRSDLGLQINPPPAHHAVLLRVRTLADPPGYLFLLLD